MRNKGKLMLAVVMAVCMTAGAIAFAPTKAAASGDSFATISAGTSQTTAIKADGSMWAWGEGFLTEGKALVPVKVMDSVAYVSEGTYHGMAIKTDGSLWAWGCNENGELGNGKYKDYYLGYYLEYSPVKVMDDVVFVSAGRNHTMAIKSDASLWAWGSNEYGQLGDGTQTIGMDNEGNFVITENNDKYLPVKVMDNVTFVSAGLCGTMAIKTDGSLWAWGINANGQLGGGIENNTIIPIKIMDDVASVSMGIFYTMVIKKDGSLWGWGSNDNGQLGNGKPTEYYRDLSPVKVMDDVVSVSAGWDFTMAIKTDGSLWAWGVNDEGQLGDGTTTIIKRDWDYGDVTVENNDKYEPIKVMDNVAYVSTGLKYAVVVKTDGSLWAWGWNDYGQLGDGTTTNKNTPVKIMDGVKLPSNAVAPKPVPTPAPTLAQNSAITVLFKEQKLNLTLPILNINGRTMYPFRECLEAMGTAVSWDAGSKTAKGTLNGKTVEFVIDSGTYKVNGEQMQMDAGVTAFIRDGRTYIPIRYAAEGLGFAVEWDEKTQTINIK